MMVTFAGRDCEIYHKPARYCEIVYNMAEGSKQRKASAHWTKASLNKGLRVLLFEGRCATV